jgi:hypothetical protein
MVRTIERFKSMKGHLLYVMVLVVVTVVMGACVIPGQGSAPQDTQAPAPIQEPIQEPPATPTAEPTVEPTPEPTLEPTPEPVVEATPDPTEYFPTPEEIDEMQRLSRYLIDSISQPIPAPAGWEIRPCEGMAPLLCIETETGEVGSSEVGAYALRTYPNFHPILARYGIPPGAIDVASQIYEESAPQVLQEMVIEIMASLAADRAIGRPQLEFVPLEVKPIEFGELPGLQYGFMMTDSAGVVQERVLSHLAFDESHIYFFVAVYDPEAVWSLPSDDILLAFEPYLLDILADLPLPKEEGWQ